MAGYQPWPSDQYTDEPEETQVGVAAFERNALYASRCAAMESEEGEMPAFRKISREGIDGIAIGCGEKGVEVPILRPLSMALHQLVKHDSFGFGYKTP